MAIFPFKRRRDRQPVGGVSNGAQPDGALAPDGDGDERITESGLPRGNLAYLVEGYGLHSRSSVPSNGASAPDGEWHSDIPRGKFLYVNEGYGPLPDED